MLAFLPTCFLQRDTMCSPTSHSGHCAFCPCWIVFSLQPLDKINPFPSEFPFFVRCLVTAMRKAANTCHRESRTFTNNNTPRLPFSRSLQVVCWGGDTWWLHGLHQIYSLALVPHPLTQSSPIFPPAELYLSKHSIFITILLVVALWLPFLEHSVHYRSPDSLRLTDRPFREVSGDIKISFILKLGFILQSIDCSHKSSCPSITHQNQCQSCVGHGDQDLSLFLSPPYSFPVLSHNWAPSRMLLPGWVWKRRCRERNPLAISEFEWKGRKPNSSTATRSQWPQKLDRVPRCPSQHQNVSPAAKSSTTIKVNHSLRKTILVSMLSYTMIFQVSTLSKNSIKSLFLWWNDILVPLAIFKCPSC